jgi:Putative Ig domain
MNTSKRLFGIAPARLQDMSRVWSFALIGLILVAACAYWSVAAQGPALPQGRDGEPYAKYQMRFTGGVEPITWSVNSGQLPLGLSLSGSGVLSGIPQPEAALPRPHTYQFTIQARDSSAAHTTATQIFSLNILAAPPPPPVPVANPSIVAELAFEFTSSSNNEETISVDQESQNINGVDPANVCVKGANPEEVTKSAQQIIASTLGADENAKFQVGDYCVIDLVRWKDAAASKSDKEGETVALFERVKGGLWKPHFDPHDNEPNLCKRSYDTRIFGSKRVAILPIHFNTPATWDLKYKVSVTQTTPTPIADALALAGNISGAAAVGPAAAPPPPRIVWGAKLMLIKYRASEIVVQLNAVPAPRSGQPAEQSKESSLKLINEGRYHWDVSIGLPVKTLRELTFVSDPTNGNKISASAKERQDVYGFFNYFPKAVDLKGDHFLTPPHFLLGVPLAGKPLQRPIVGVGTGMYKGPVKFNIFAGVVFIRERVPTALSVGQQASQTQLDNDLHTRWVRKFTFGINFPVSQITNAIKGKK